MAYGERKGIKMPGEFRLADYFGFSIAGSLGIVTAMLVDMRQSADASALFVINKWVSELGGIFGFGELPLYAVVLLMMVIGAASVLYFQPVSMQGAFAQGFGVLAALMTIAPSDFGAPLDAPIDDLDILPAPTAQIHPQAGAQLTAFVGMSNGLQIGEYIDYGVYHPNEARIETIASVAQRPAQANSNAYDLTIQINFPEGLKADFESLVRNGNLRGRLHNKSTGKTYNLFRNGGAYVTPDGNSITIRTSLPGKEDSTDLYARVEAAGYAITIEQFEAKKGRNPTWQINMTPSNTPLFVQRFGKSYWF
ncbi:MAG: hypothetical protein ACWA5L_01200 [bacterium]